MRLKIINGAISLTIRFGERSVFKCVVDEIESTCQQPMRIRIMTEALKNECAGRLMFDLAARCDFVKSASESAEKGLNPFRILSWLSSIMRRS